jgi:hypothetical protein
MDKFAYFFGGILTGILGVAAAAAMLDDECSPAKGKNSTAEATNDDENSATTEMNITAESELA